MWHINCILHMPLKEYRDFSEKYHVWVSVSMLLSAAQTVKKCLSRYFEDSLSLKPYYSTSVQVVCNSDLFSILLASCTLNMVASLKDHRFQFLNLLSHGLHCGVHEMSFMNMETHFRFLFLS